MLQYLVVYPDLQPAPKDANTMPWWAIGIELLVLAALELIDRDMRWHRQHPGGNELIARQHEELDRLEGRW